MVTKLLLLLGTSGAGKSSIIPKLKKLDPRFVHLVPYVTRELRKGEKDRIHISKTQLAKMKNDGKILITNKIYGGYYATPMVSFKKAIMDDKFPVFECPVTKVSAVRKKLGKNLVFSAYVEPESLEFLENALSSRNNSAKRLKASKIELRELHEGKYRKLIDFHIINRQGELDKVAKSILKEYLK